MKKITAIVLALVLALACIPALAATEADYAGEWYMIWSDDNDGDAVLVLGDAGMVAEYRLNEDGTFALVVNDWYNGTESGLNSGSWYVDENGVCVMNATDGKVFTAEIGELTDPATGNNVTVMNVVNGAYLDVYTKDTSLVQFPVVFDGYSQTAAEEDFNGKWLMAGIEDFGENDGYYSAYTLGLEGWVVEIDNGSFMLDDTTEGGLDPLYAQVENWGPDSEGDVRLGGSLGDGSVMVYIDADGDTIYVFGILTDCMMILSKEGTLPERPQIIIEKELPFK